MLPPVFIVGCARSGTTILGEFFEKNSQCEYYFEMELWDKKVESILNKILWKTILSNKFFTSKNIRIIHYAIADSIGTDRKYKIKGHRLTEKDILPEHVERISKICENLGKEKRLIVKNPRDSLRIPFIKKLFPDAKFVHIVRDGRDVTCSLMSGMEGRLWEHQKPSGWQKWLMEETHKKCAWTWNETIKIVKNDLAFISREDFFEIRYEDLLANPEKTIKVLFKEYEIPFEKHQEELCHKIQNKMENSYQTKISDKWLRDDHSKRIGRYKENLSEEQLRDVENILSETNSLFHYE